MYEFRLRNLWLMAEADSWLRITVEMFKFSGDG
jgi:hypothetical protein